MVGPTNDSGSMSWIQTYTGKRFFPLQPERDHIDIVDIAHALSLQCRFNGHCRTFYSVAEHSVRVSHMVPSEHARWGLLHDAAEAYISDIPRPLKRQLPTFVAVENQLLEVIAAHFGLPLPIPEAVLVADTRLLATEARDLMAPAPAPWDLDGIAPAPERVEPWSAAEAEQRYLDRYRELTPTDG